jgi:hypothetical protein
MTERGEYTCVVKEGADGEPSLVFEPSGGQEPLAFKGKNISLELRPDVSLSQAEELARQIRKLSVGLAVTPGKPSLRLI